MSKGLAIFNSAIAAIMLPLSLALGGWDFLLKILVSFIVIDYITGVLIGIINKKLSSSVGFKGLAKKIVIFFMVFVAVQCDKAIGTEMFRTYTILFYLSNEGISILENAGRLEVPIPQKLKSILIQLKQKTERDDVTDGK